MSKVIDLDFFRKYRIILPLRPSPLSKQKSFLSTRASVKQLRRRRKSNTKPKALKED